jgi:hypothetical protein
MQYLTTGLITGKIFIVIHSFRKIKTAASWVNAANTARIYIHLGMVIHNVERKNPGATEMASNLHNVFEMLGRIDKPALFSQ